MRAKKRKPKSERRFRTFGTVFIPFQFVIVWVIYFGFRLEPEVLRVVKSFNITGITLAALEFWRLIPIAFTAEAVVFFIGRSMPLLFALARQCVPLGIFLVALWQLVQYIYGVLSHWAYRNALSLKIAFTIKCGAPGTGKSSSAAYDATHKAAVMWEYVQTQYWLLAPTVDRLRASGNTAKLKKWEEIRDAYEFWSTKDCTPCFASNIPVKDTEGRFSLRLTRDHIYQKTRLPVYTVALIDEISSMVDVTNSAMDRPLEVADLFRWARHFGFIFIATEQDAGRVQIDMRRVAGQIILFEKQKAICKPIPVMLLLWLFRWIPKILYYKKPPVINPTFSSAIRFLQKLEDYTGFRKFIFRFETNPDTGGGNKSRRRAFCLPSTLNCNYDDRTFREFYKPLNEEISYDIFNSLQMSEAHKESFMRKTKAEIAMTDKSNVAMVRAIYGDEKRAALAEKHLAQTKKERALLSALSDEEIKDAITDIFNMTLESPSKARKAADGKQADPNNTLPTQTPQRGNSRQFDTPQANKNAVRPSPKSEKEVTDFCTANNINIDVVRFYNYYVEHSWLDKSGEPFDWQEKIKTWDRKPRR